ncbi:hypothetical protein DRH27_04210 [Candidatus Falkowbacteria bacterium]|nr:MAG: hypothetical protein DRH27_04210 [Candidatus Falkowbacteria bacterium]
MNLRDAWKVFETYGKYEMPVASCPICSSLEDEELDEDGNGIAYEFKGSVEWDGFNIHIAVDHLEQHTDKERKKAKCLLRIKR